MKSRKKIENIKTPYLSCDILRTIVYAISFRFMNIAIISTLSLLISIVSNHQLIFFPLSNEREAQQAIGFDV